MTGVQTCALPICTGDRDQDHPHGKEMQKSKMGVWGGLTNSCEKKRSEKQMRKDIDENAEGIQRKSELSFQFYMKVTSLILNTFHSF